MSFYATFPAVCFFGIGWDGRDVFLVDFVHFLDIVKVEPVVHVVDFDWNVFFAHLITILNYYNHLETEMH